MTQHQIAERLGVSQMHVSRLLARCLEDLRRRAEAASAALTARPTAVSGDRWSRSRRCRGATSPRSSTSVKLASSTRWITSWAMRSPRSHHERLGGVEVDQDHLELVAVAAVDQARACSGRSRRA